MHLTNLLEVGMFQMSQIWVECLTEQMHNQNMKQWCVSQFSSEPGGFSLNNSISNSNEAFMGYMSVIPIYFENGTCKCPNASVGDTAVIGGKTYTVVDRAGLQTLANNGADVTGVCTSKITNMEGMFNGKYSRQFNQDVSHYDVSNVTNFKTMFAFQPLFNQDLSKWDTSKGSCFLLCFYIPSVPVRHLTRI